MSSETELPTFNLDEAIAMLERTPAILGAWRADLPVLEGRECGGRESPEDPS